MKSVSRRSVMGLAVAAAGMTLSPAAFAEGKLAVGAYPTNPPWEAKNDSGVFEGFEVDLIREVGKRLGMEVEIADMGFQALFAATSSNRIDAAISSITITKERLQNQSFTQGYYDSDLCLATRAAKPKKLSELKGLKLGALATSTGEKWIKANMEKLGVTDYSGYDTQQNLLLDLQNGRLDGAISDIAGFEFAFLKMTDLKVQERIPQEDKFAVMMRKGHPLLEKVNAAIGAMKKDGTMAALHKKWLGFDADPSTSTVQERPLPTP